ncbi:MAG: hypothetical protein EA409_10440 [Saprospirales bacterium]|nr:MAG: hypothetical protein EA409_10440 [Saprospirales bacterium]
MKKFIQIIGFTKNCLAEDLLPSAINLGLELRPLDYSSIPLRWKCTKFEGDKKIGPKLNSTCYFKTNPCHDQGPFNEPISLIDRDRIKLYFSAYGIPIGSGISPFPLS